MGSNVQKIDLEELRKAREALNAELGVSTPEPVKKPKKIEQPEIPEKQESNENKEYIDKNVSEQNNGENAGIEDNSLNSSNSSEFKNVDNSNVQGTDLDNNQNLDDNKDLSMYDNFSQFEINSEDEVPTIEIKKGIEESDKKEPEESDEEDYDDLLDILNDFVGQDLGVDPDELDYELDNEEKSSDAYEDINDNAILNEDKDITQSNEISNESEDIKGNDETVESGKQSEIETTKESKIQSDVDQLDNLDDNKERLSRNTDYVTQTDNLRSDISDNINNSANKNLESVVTDNVINNIKSTATQEESYTKQKYETISNQTKRQMNEETSAEPKPFTAFAVPNVDGINNKTAETVSDKNNKDSVINSSENTKQGEVSDDKPNIKKEIEENTEQKTAKLDSSNEKIYLKKIEDVNFIDIIRSKSFMGSDNLTCIYGVDEESNVYCQNFKDFYNTIIFSENEKSVFNLFSSIIMSLLLKNSRYDINFVICDAKIGGQFSVYNNLSYMLYDTVAESNREIIQNLKDLCHEIDSRYKSLAKANAKSIEKFNDEMKKAKVAPLPYIVLFFNNYTRASHLDDSNEIDNNLTYILRFGRLVGVYVNLVSFDENIADKINFNLQTRISFKTDLAESSISQLGEEGAEKIGYDDEYIIKTLYSDKLEHLKTPIITQKEIELLIKNIEK